MKVVQVDRSFMPPPLGRGADLTITNAAWVATALLQRAQPEQLAFAPSQIVAMVMEMRLTRGSADSVWTHVLQHSVGNKKPQPNTVCMLFDSGDGTRRLWRRGDVAYPGRNTARIHPEWADLPAEYRDLQVWYERVWEPLPGDGLEDPLLALAGTWNGISADEYVAGLRKGWEERG